jgi:hypothetical protein
MERERVRHSSSLILEALEARQLLTAADPTLLQWGQNVYSKINASLRVPGSNLYSETASVNGTRSGGDGGFAYVWPESVQFRVLNDLVTIFPGIYTSAARGFSDELYSRYWKNSGLGGYRSGVSGGSELFYDDNAHIAVALAQAYTITKDPVYLTRAVQTYNFVLSGEDSAGGGGIYFKVNDPTSKNTISTLQAVRAALQLYQITGTSKYLTDATRLYTWSKTHVQQSNGLFKEGYALTGPDAATAVGFALTNGAGIGLLCNLEFYRATGNAAYLREAQRIGQSARSAYFNSSTGALNDEGYWTFELVDALDDLYTVDHNPAWVNATAGAMSWLHANREDPNGHYGTLWARDAYTPGTVRQSWNMIDQAAVAESYLHTAVAKAAPSIFVTAAGDVVTGFYNAVAGGTDRPSSVGSGAGQYPSTSTPAKAIDDDAATKYLNFGNGSSSISSASKGVGTGLIVTPALGPSVVTGIQVATAADTPTRDPLRVSIEGTNAMTNLDSGSSWTLIADNVNLGIDADPGRQMFGPVAAFANTTAYRSYRVIVKAQRGSDTAVQYAEMNLVGVRDTVPPAVVGGAFDVAGAAVAIQFSEDVADSLAAGDLVVRNVTTGQTLSADAMSVTWDGKTRTARWTFPGYPGGLPDGNYRATLATATVADPAHHALASPYALDFFTLAGDANHDRSVDFNDLVPLAQHYNTVGGMTFDDGDFNYDGNVDFNDLVLLAQRYNTTLAAPPVAAPVVAAPAAVAPPVFSTSRVAKAARPRPAIKTPAPAQKRAPVGSDARTL